MVADATAVLEEHPYTVLLGLVDVLHIETAAAKSLHIDTGEGLVTAIVFRLDKAVELTVIHLLQFIALVLGQIGKVVRKTLADFLNLRAGQLDFLHVRRLDVVAVIVGTHTLLNIRCRVVEGMLQQCHAVVVLILATHTVFLADFQVIAVLGLDRVFIDMLGIVNLHLRVEELADIFLVILRGNPSLTELQTDVVKGNLLGQRLLQCGLGLLQGGNDLGVIGMFLSQFNGIVHIGQLIIDIAGEGLAADFVAAIGHVIDTSFQLIDQIGLRMASDTGHILQVHLTIAIQ